MRDSKPKNAVLVSGPLTRKTVKTQKKTPQKMRGKNKFWVFGFYGGKGLINHPSPNS